MVLCYPRNLFKWVERLKSELPYYESCNTGTLNSEQCTITI